MTRPECAPKPVEVVLKKKINSTDESEESDIATEDKIDTRKMTFAPRHEAFESTGPY